MKKIDDTSHNINIVYDDKINKKDYKERKHFFRKFFFSIILIIILIILYSRYIGPTGLIIKEYPINNTKITDIINGFKIVHFSDFHYGNTTDINSLKKLVSEINLMKPDIVVFTGDLVDKSIKINDKERSDIIDYLSKIKSNYGKYYITGEDDEKLNKYIDLMDSAGFNNINDNFDIIYIDSNNSILLSGINLSNDISFIDKVIKDNNINYKINIMHYPDNFDKIKKYNYDLVLAGHSHNGQISLPIYGRIITKEHCRKYYKPYYKINDTDFYISSGIGTSDFKFRFLNKPSFNLYRLRKK